MTRPSFKVALIHRNGSKWAATMRPSSARARQSSYLFRKSLISGCAMSSFMVSVPSEPRLVVVSSRKILRTSCETVKSSLIGRLTLVSSMRSTMRLSAVLSSSGLTYLYFGTVGVGIVGATILLVAVAGLGAVVVLGVGFPAASLTCGEAISSAVTALDEGPGLARAGTSTPLNRTFLPLGSGLRARTLAYAAQAAIAACSSLLSSSSDSSTSSVSSTARVSEYADASISSATSTSGCDRQYNPAITVALAPVAGLSCRDLSMPCWYVPLSRNPWIHPPSDLTNPPSISVP